jgi:pilus assembly protein FimV
LPKGAVDHLAEPLDFDLPVQGQAAASDMMRTVVLPSAQGGDARGDDVTLDLEKTGFDPSALDFDLDLDLKPDTAAAARAMQSSVPAGDQGGAVDDGEIDTRLELAMAYRDMGDSEGALELLNQVVAEGNATQRAEAKALIANLS